MPTWLLPTHSTIIASGLIIGVVLFGLQLFYDKKHRESADTVLNEMNELEKTFSVETEPPHQAAS